MNNATKGYGKHILKKHLEVTAIDFQTPCHLYPCLGKLINCINLQYCHISLIVFDLL